MSADPDSKFWELHAALNGMPVMVNFDQVVCFRPMGEGNPNGNCSILLTGEGRPLYVLETYERVKELAQ